MSIVPKQVARLSPSSINTYKRCPRLFYYQYILGIQPEPNIHLVRGLIVHKVMEKFFNLKSLPNEDWRTFIEKHAEKLLDGHWDLSGIVLKPEEEERVYKETKKMVEMFVSNFIDKVEISLLSEKIENPTHALHLLKPKFRELRIELNDLHISGIIDKIYKSYDNKIIIGDYKTSNKYGLCLPDDYRRQLSLYAYMYNKHFKEKPDFVAVHYLKYGETFFLEVTQNMLDYAQKEIDDVWKNSRSTDIKDYPIHPETAKFCDCDRFETEYKRALYHEQSIKAKKKKETNKKQTTLASGTKG